MTQKQRYQITSKMRRDMGVCVRCGKNDAISGAYCETCREKTRIYYSEIRRIALDNGLCPRCGKNKLYGNEKSCPECKAKQAEYNQTYSATHKDIIKSYYARNRERNRKTYAERKAKGLCPKCGKYRPSDGYSRCYECRERDRVNAIRRKAVNE